MKILNLTIVLWSSKTPSKKRREASTFNCNARRLLFKNKAKNYTDSQNKRSL